MTNATNMSPVIDRVQKLLALAKNAGSDAEAALAAQRAAELMAQHELSEAELQIVAGAARVVEEIAHTEIDRGKKNRVAWKSTIAAGVAQAYGCHMYWTGPAIKIFGRLSATQAVSYTCQYLWSEVENLTDAAWAKADVTPSKRTTKAWKNAFRVGAANAIASRLWQDKNARKAAVKTALDEQTSLSQLSSASQALMVVDKDEQEVADEYANYSRGFGKAVHIGRVSRRDAYAQGVTAGRSVAIGAQRAGLKRGTEVLG